MSYPQNINSFRKKFPEMRTIWSTPTLFDKSGSRWNLQRLQALRVLHIPRTSGRGSRNLGFESLDDYWASAEETVSQVAEKNKLPALSLQNVKCLRHQKLRNEGAAFASFFVPLAEVVRSNEDEEMVEEIRSPRPKRRRLEVSRPDMTPGEGLSSPQALITPEKVPQSSQGSSYSPESNSDEEADFHRQLQDKKNEVVSRTMASQFISTVIDLLSGQDMSHNKCIEFREAPTPFVLHSNAIHCKCEHDGAIIVRRKKRRSQKWAGNDFQCSLEVKPAFRKQDWNSDTGIVAEQVLAQQTCELLGSVMTLISDVLGGTRQKLQLPQSRRILISVHQTTMAFLSCEFTPEYLDYIYGDKESGTNKETDDPPFLHIYQSQDYKLSDPIERESAATAIVALVKYFASEKDSSEDNVAIDDKSQDNKRVDDEADDNESEDNETRSMTM